MDVYGIITKRMIEILEAGIVPWHHPWRSVVPPRNLVSRKTYSAINVWLLTVRDYASPYWGTIKQINTLGGHVRTGEKASPVVFWRISRKGVESMVHEQFGAGGEPQETLGKRRFALRYYRVFNAEQCVLPKSISQQLVAPEVRILDPIGACEKMLARMPNPPRIQHSGRAAFYSPRTDCITILPRETFESADEYWSIFWHEAGHATGHPKRLDRRPFGEVVPFGSAVYNKEELLAEMTAAYLCGVTGIQNRAVDNSPAHTGGWIDELRSDRKLIVYSACQAQRVCDYILNGKISSSDYQD